MRPIAASTAARVLFFYSERTTGSTALHARTTPRRTPTSSAKVAAPMWSPSLAAIARNEIALSQRVSTPAPRVPTCRADFCHFGFRTALRWFPISRPFAIEAPKPGSPSRSIDGAVCPAVEPVPGTNRHAPSAERHFPRALRLRQSSFDEPSQSSTLLPGRLGHSIEDERGFESHPPGMRCLAGTRSRNLEHLACRE